MNAAVGIQRLLASHRSEHGFAPWVRIGLHTTEANVEGSDYSGHGVHLAARVGDIGSQEQIVVTPAVLDAAGAVGYPVGEVREVELKGISEPVSISLVDWR